MPYFNYRCNKCDKGFEALSNCNGDDIRCPTCGVCRVTKEVGTRIAVVTSVQRKGGIVDLSSGACPGCANHTHH